MGYDRRGLPEEEGLGGVGEHELIEDDGTDDGVEGEVGETEDDAEDTGDGQSDVDDLSALLPGLVRQADHSCVEAEKLGLLAVLDEFWAVRRHGGVGVIGSERWFDLAVHLDLF